MQLSRGLQLRRVVAVLSAALLSAGACAPLASAPPSGSPAAVPGGRVVAYSSSDPVTLNPVLSNDALTSDLGSLIYRGLLRQNGHTGLPVPGLAARSEVSADGRTLTFHLQPGLRWSDGVELTGEDFKFTVEAVLRSEKSIRKSNFQDIVGAKDFRERRAATISGISIDGDVVRVRLERAFCPALSLIGGFQVLPRHIFSKYTEPAAFDSAPENTLPAVSSGPFTLREREPGKRLLFVRNGRYYGSPALLDELEVRILPPNEMKGALLAGEVDVAQSIADPALRDELRRSGRLDVRSFRGLRYTYIGWNQLRGGKEFFQSKAVRQALAYGFDVDAVLDKVMGGEALKMLSHTHPASWAYDPSGLNEYRYSPQRAEELLKSDGWARGSDGVHAKGGQRLAFSIVTFTSVDNEALLREAVEQYRRIGIEVTPVIEPVDPFFARLLSSRDPVYGAHGGRDVDAFIVRWVLGPDPDAYSIWHSTQTSANNFIGYRNAVVDRAVEDGRTKCSLEERKAAYRTMDRELNEDQPYRFVLAPNSLVISAKHVQGLEPATFGGSFGTFWNAERWWVKR